MIYEPRARVLTWPADDRSGAGTQRIILKGNVSVAEDEIGREFNFTTIVDAIPDDWAAFAGEWAQRGTWVRCEATDDGSYAARFTFTVSGISTAPTAGAIYSQGGVNYTILETLLTGAGPNIAGPSRLPPPPRPPNPPSPAPSPK